MKKVIFCLALLSLVSLGHAQLANKSNLNGKDVQDRVNGLLASKDPKAKDSISWEASQLVESKNEEYIKHGKSIFNYLGDRKSVEAAHQKLLKQFPKSSYSASNSLDNILKDYTDVSSLDMALGKWKKQYKKALEKQSFADGSYAKICDKLVATDAVEAAQRYAVFIVNEGLKFNFEYSLALQAFEQGDHAKSDMLVEALIAKYPQVIAEHKSTEKRLYALQAQVFAKQQKWAEALRLMEAHDISLEDIKFQALMKTGRSFDAFLMLDTRFANSALTPLQERSGALLFENLGSTAAQWQAYKERIEQKKAKENEQHWKNSLINEASFDFELTDMNGKLVKSSDYNGKIIVLDFWATWCGPCVNSFPGMQATVDKYKDDPEVVFLFINTWERGADYKTKVQSFIAEKGYRFHVVFDKMDAKDALVSKYGITGIPTKIIIDKNGRVRFKSSGSSPDVKEIVDEISYKIDLIKNTTSNRGSE